MKVQSSEFDTFRSETRSVDCLKVRGDTLLEALPRTQHLLITYSSSRYYAVHLEGRLPFLSYVNPKLSCTSKLQKPLYYSLEWLRIEND